MKRDIVVKMSSMQFERFKEWAWHDPKALDVGMNWQTQKKERMTYRSYLCTTRRPISDFDLSLALCDIHLIIEENPGISEEQAFEKFVYKKGHSCRFPDFRIMLDQLIASYLVAEYFKEGV